MSNPTDHQAIRLESLLSWSKSDEPYAALTGSAGTGKSYLTKAFTENCNTDVALTAMTHQAAKVLSDFTDRNTGTIHSLLSLKPKRDKDKFVLKQGETMKPELQEAKIVLVDESSMLDTPLMEFVKEDVKKYNRKYLFVGDEYQILPIGEPSSPAFTYCKPFELIDIVRQNEGSPIITLATQLREMIKDGRPSKDFLRNENISGVGSVESFDSTTEFLECVDEFDFINSEDSGKILCWTNDQVHKYNSLINSSYGIDKVPFAVGSMVVFNEPLIQNDEVIVPNSWVGKCTRITKKERMNSYYLYEVEIDNIENKAFYVVPEECKAEHDMMKQFHLDAAISNRKMWGEYYKYMEMYSDIRPMFSSTVHKAQGQTFTKSFVDAREMRGNRNIKELMRQYYTAITRASDNVYINGKLFG